jgi:hypothetical protein
MKYRVFIRFAALLLPVMVGSLHAQEIPPYPGGPPLKRAPDMSSWQVTCQATAPTGTPALPGLTTPPPPILPFVTMTVVKTKDRRSIESIDAAGLKTIRFFDGSMESYTAPGTLTARYFTGENKKMPGFYIDFSRTDFPECGWITPEKYSGIEVRSDHKCLVFTDNAAKPAQAAGNSSSPSDAASSTAYVDLDTRLPVNDQVGRLTYTYQYLPAPTEMLSLPTLMKARIDFDAQRAKALSVHPAAE